MRAFFVLCYFIICISILSSCTKPQEVKHDVLQVKPLTLFDGETQKFQPFMGPMSGAVHLNYKGAKQSIQVSAEIWENGVKTQTLGRLSTVLQGEEEERTFDGEFIVSIKDAEKEGSGYVAIVAITHEGGSASTQLAINSSVKHTSKMLVTLSEAIEVPDIEEAAVWGMQATDENGMSTIDLTPESVKNAKWVILFKIGLLSD